MSKTFQAIMLRGQGDLDRLEDVELPMVEPGSGEVRVKIVAAGAGSTDVLMRKSKYLFAPPFPFVPGYELLGTIDAIGPGVTGFHLGQRVAALTVHGAFAEYLVREAEHFVPVPDGLDDAEATALILNYITACQMIHRVAKLREGQSALVTGASGGVGTALLQLLRVAKVRAIAACSARQFDFVRSLGGEPVLSRGEGVDVAVRRMVPGGVDAAFDIIGGRGASVAVRATRLGGITVGYGSVGATSSNGMPSRWLTMRGFASLFIGAHLRGRRGTFYGITLLYRKNKQPFKEDLRNLFTLLSSGAIKPVIAHRLPLLAARESQRLIEAGGLSGKIVLLRSLGLRPS
jgi:NADPH2:quinone reductase